MTRNILFICGSLNQTTMMRKIAAQLGEHSCTFTPYYADGLEDFGARMGWLDFSVLGGRHRKATVDYLARHNLPVDWRGEGRDYDLVVTCSDLIIQKNIRNKRIVLVQEGITEPEGWMYRLVKKFKLPRYLANTAAAGLSGAYDVFCVASEGYAQHFIRKGVRKEKIAVTGIPNFDDLRSAFDNDFPYHGHTLAATTPFRESFRRDDRAAFIEKCNRLANGRLLIFKLHPAENVERATREIRRHSPGALILTEGNVNHMMANASLVITQQSTSTFVALALGKEVDTYLDTQALKDLMPIQNGGASAKRIAEVCRRVLHAPVRALEKVRRGYLVRSKWDRADGF